ncbi:hypothetical protein M9H77_07963 [Catharanthus roseus]|uniref:Uncharacterized protein n=1 Tax=Catharanthus roseus TaxID=4058 RepID=A0ACC0BWR4_CATRO|nr:hypothetical protein M9H77_07963 [Catharanthus roseus]
MDVDLITKIQDMSLNTEAKSQLEFGHRELEEGNQRFHPCCLFRIHSNKEIPFGVIFDTMVGLWDFPTPELVSIQPNRYKAFFSSEDDIYYIFKKGPWRIERCVVVLVRWKPDLFVTEEEFNIVDYSIHVYDLPEEAYTQKVAARVAACFACKSSV